MQGVAGLDVIGVQLDHPLQVRLPLLLELMFQAPLGQFPLAVGRVGILRTDPLVFHLVGRQFDDLFDLRGLQRDLAAGGQPDEVLLRMLLVAIEPLAVNPAAVGQSEHLGDGGRRRGRQHARRNQQGRAPSAAHGPREESFMPSPRARYFMAVSSFWQPLPLAVPSPATCISISKRGGGGQLESPLNAGFSGEDNPPG